MTVQNFQTNYADQLKTFLETPCGQNFLTVLGSLRPPYEFSEHDHLLAENRGAMRGYELALRNALAMAMPPRVSQDPEINYGVTESVAK